ncbi:MAG: hypothetical protein WC855_04700 [Thermodesulfovibrionales bacterium]
MSDRDKTISLLLPTYRRTESLDKVLVSIEERTAYKNRITLSLYIDDDDSESIAYISSDKLKKFSYCINPIIAPHLGSIGSMINYLQQNAPHADIYMPMADDYILATNSWDTILNDIFSEYPDGMLLVFPQDITSLGNVTFIILGGRWIDTLGRFLTNYFPFWFDDGWLDQVAQMAQRRIAVPIKVATIGGKGKTNGMFNLWFWHQFFRNTLDERIEDANKIRRAIYPNDCADYHASKSAGDILAERFDLQFSNITKYHCLLNEFMLADRGKMKHIYLDSKYLIKEICAVQRLCDKLIVDLESEHHRKYQLIENIAAASFRSKHIAALSGIRNSINTIKIIGIVQNLQQELNAVLSTLKAGHTLNRNQVHLPKYPAMILFKALLAALKNIHIANRFNSLFRSYFSSRS